ncbi:dihydrodipicolinate synthase family protein [Phytoactinopolyspora alkaliphila]|uniref:Dihydrodipicolinate synthase family protein n=1 Tax=Phytoactinopolyspora alkaliphila TaxID=1783498 RepID=A0A6N9YSM0_9ACTN|nr:dihydrodipicolinate synthase family protein [Phytoactinopolyspora alkaliphila]
MNTALPDGIVTPLVTFVTDAGTPDAEAMAALVDYQIDGGVHGLLALGSTGEIGNLSAPNRLAVLRAVVESTAGRVPVWAGVAGLGTADAVAAAASAESCGVDALLVLPPMFFDAGDDELAAHFRAVAAAVSVPLIAYDVPQRSPRKLPLPVIRTLAEEGTLSGVKDSSGDLTAGRLLCAGTSQVATFRAYVGSEIVIDSALHLGFQGAVPGLANILPAPAVDTFHAIREGDIDRAARSQQVYIDLLAILEVPLLGAGGPARAIGAIKTATARMLGLPAPALTEPFTQPTADFTAAIDAVLASIAA